MTQDEVNVYILKELSKVHIVNTNDSNISISTRSYGTVINYNPSWLFIVGGVFTNKIVDEQKIKNFFIQFFNLPSNTHFTFHRT